MCVGTECQGEFSYLRQRKYKGAKKHQNMEYSARDIKMKHIKENTELFEMTVGVLTNRHTQYT